VGVLLRKPEVLQLIGVTGQAPSEAIIAALRRCAIKCSPEFLAVVADLQALEEAIATGLVRGRHPLLVSKGHPSGLPNPPLPNGAGIGGGHSKLWHARDSGPQMLSSWDASGNVSNIAKVGNMSVVAHADYDRSRTVASGRTAPGSTLVLLENTQDSSVGNTLTGTLTSVPAFGIETAPLAMSPAQPRVVGPGAHLGTAHGSGPVAAVELSPPGRADAGLSLNAATGSTHEGARRSGSGAAMSVERPSVLPASIGASPLKSGAVWAALESPAVLRVPQ
jgi:hypothetical protein